MKRVLNSRWAMLLEALSALAVSVFLSVSAAAAPAPIDASDLSNVGFKVLVATTKVQQDWVKGLPAGKIRPMQRTGKKYFIFPDAPSSQIYVGGPKEYEAYVQLHPEHRAAGAQQAAREASAYRGKQDDAMRKATARDLSDPFLGASWADLGW